MLKVWSLGVGAVGGGEKLRTWAEIGWIARVCFCKHIELLTLSLLLLSGHHEVNILHLPTLTSVIVCLGTGPQTIESSNIVNTCNRAQLNIPP